MRRKHWFAVSRRIMCHLSQQLRNRSRRRVVLQPGLLSRIPLGLFVGLVCGKETKAAPLPLLPSNFLWQTQIDTGAFWRLATSRTMALYQSLASQFIYGIYQPRTITVHKSKETDESRLTTRTFKNLWFVIKKTKDQICRFGRAGETFELNGRLILVDVSLLPPFDIFLTMTIIRTAHQASRSTVEQRGAAPCHQKQRRTAMYMVLAMV